jgi:hypothetical protein
MLRIISVAGAFCTLMAVQAHADCVRKGVDLYGQVYYIGNAFTNVDGGISTSDKVFIFLNVNKCLAKNHTYNIRSNTFSIVGASVGTTAINSVWNLQWSKGATTYATGTITTGDSPLPASWNITLYDQKKSPALFIGSGNTQDVGQGTQNGTSGYGFIDNAPGSWQLQ